MSEYSFEVSPLDVSVALDCEADRAEREKCPSTASRQREAALHIRNASHHMQRLCPPGYRVATKVTFTLVPDVPAALRDEVRSEARFQGKLV